jgi:hypothetical protein
MPALEREAHTGRSSTQCCDPIVADCTEPTCSSWPLGRAAGEWKGKEHTPRVRKARRASKARLGSAERRWLESAVVHAVHAAVRGQFSDEEVAPQGA